jgi:hypothetical protein
MKEKERRWSEKSEEEEKKCRKCKLNLPSAEYI